MASHKKDHLKKLLDFLDKEIIHEPSNEWFVDELRNILPTPKNNTLQASDSLIRIEKYLGLDFNIDSTSHIIDYSFVKNEYLRDCFEADFREMLRFRFGTRGHRISFPEFCRFALIQAERLLNLYYNSKGNIYQSREYIKKFNPNARGIENASTLDSISFSIKLWAYHSEHKIQPLYNVFDKVRRVRNSQSHGSVSQPDDIFFQQHYSELMLAGFPLLPNCQVNWSELSKNEKLKEKYELEIKNSDKHKHYILLTWQRQYPFDEVLTALHVLSMLVAQSLNHS